MTKMSINESGNKVKGEIRVKKIISARVLGGMAAMHGQGDLPLPGFSHVMPPYSYKYAEGMTDEEFGIYTANKIE